MDKENKNSNVPNLRFPDYNDSLKNICLSELLSFQNGINADSDKYGKGIKYISVGDIINNDYITYDCIKGKVDISQKELNNYLVENGDILFQRSSETFEDIGNANVYLDEQPCTFGGFVIRGKKIGEYDPKYLNYLLKSPNARKQVIRLGAGAQHYNINQESLNKIILSFPSAKEQEKISRFLTKIEEQIQLQNKIIEGLISQKNIIRKEMINNLNNKQEEVKLCNLCSIVTGKRDANQMNGNGKYKFFTCSREDYYINSYSFEGDSLIISGNGEIGLIKFFSGKFDAYQRTYVLQNFTCDPIFLKCVLEEKLPRVVNKEKNVGAMPYITIGTLNNISIPLPNKPKQLEIKEIIHKLEQRIKNESQILIDYEIQKSFLLRNMFI